MAIAVAVDKARVAAFCKAHHIRKLALFGSVTRSDFRGDSDVDVLVEFEPGHVPGLAFFAMEDELGQMFGRRVDLNTPAFLSPDIRARVLAEAEVVYVAG
jgi:predicted nucleotidyltransferase